MSEEERQIEPEQVPDALEAILFPLHFAPFGLARNYFGVDDVGDSLAGEATLGMGVQPVGRSFRGV